MSRDRERFEDDYSYEVVKKIKRDTRDVYLNVTDSNHHHHHHHHMGISRRQAMSSNIPSSSLAGGSLNTITPCAACKLLRRRCAEECPFSPYFSPHEPQKFAAVHKIFGASNVSKLLLEVPESQRADAANSLVFEANLRLRDPVYGCMGVISALQQQIQSLQSELQAVRSEILRFRYREAATTTTNVVNIPSSNMNADLMISSGIISIAASSPSLSPPAQPPPPPTPPPPPSVVISSSPSSSSISSLHTPPPTSSTTAGYSPISSDNNNNNNSNIVPYFD